MRDNQESTAPLSGNGKEEISNGLAGFGVQSSGRLIGEKDARLCNQSPGNSRPLALTARKQSGRCARIRHAQLHQQLGRALVRVTVLAATQQYRQSNILHRRKFRQQFPELEDHADVLAAYLRHLSGR